MKGIRLPCLEGKKCSNHSCTQAVYFWIFKSVMVSGHVCVCTLTLALIWRTGRDHPPPPPLPSPLSLSLSLCLSLPVWGRWADTALLSPSQSLCSAGAPSLGRSPSRTVWTVWNTAHTKRQPFRSTQSGYVSVMRLSSFTNYPSRLLIVYSVCWNRCCWKVQRNIPHFLHPCNS